MFEREFEKCGFGDMVYNKYNLNHVTKSKTKYVYSLELDVCVLFHFLSKLLVVIRCMRPAARLCPVLLPKAKENNETSVGPIAT